MKRRFVEHFCGRDRETDDISISDKVLMGNNILAFEKPRQHSLNESSGIDLPNGQTIPMDVFHDTVDQLLREVRRQRRLGVAVGKRVV